MPCYQNRSVGRVLSILELLGNTTKALTLTEIARGVKLDASTAYRALRALCERGFVYRIEATRRYVLSYNAFRLGSPGPRGPGHQQPRAHDHGAAGKEVSETIRLAVLEGAEARFCAEASVTRPGLRMLGAMVDAHASAAGKALIAWRSRAEIELLYRGRSMHVYSDRTIRSVPMLLTELAGGAHRAALRSARARACARRSRTCRALLRQQRPCAILAGDRPTRKRLPPSRDKACLRKHWSPPLARCRMRWDSAARTGRRSAPITPRSRRATTTSRRASRCSRATRRRMLSPKFRGRRRGVRDSAGLRHTICVVPAQAGTHSPSDDC